MSIRWCTTRPRCGSSSSSWAPTASSLGTDYPFPLGEERPGSTIRALDDLDAAVSARMLRDNALDFLGRSAAVTA